MPSVTLTFNMNNLAFAIPINIINDNIYELDENFIGRLTTSDEDAILEPDQTIVNILNDDGMLLNLSLSYVFLDSFFLF